MYSREKYRPSVIPQNAGVYIFRDEFGKIIYVGKAKNLRKRLTNYFQPSRLKIADIKLRSLINSIFKFEFIEVKSESEALLLESKLIKNYIPQYNVLLRDDKRFLMIKIHLKELFPRIILTRLKKDDGALYFGPFPQTTVLKNTAEYLTYHFNLRSCSPQVPTIADKKHCHKHILKHCSAPCDGTISKEVYREKVNLLLDVLNGNTSSLIKELQLEMAECAEKEEFEKAAKKRDIIENLAFLFKNKRSFIYAKVGTENSQDVLLQLQKDLNLPFVPFIIDAFDNSHFQGQNTVSSLVRFVNGKPHNSSYRRYKVQTVKGIDDFASMYEVVYRRYKRVLTEKRTLPNLILIDGGKGQLSSAYSAIKELGLDNLSILGLAKKEEEIFFYGVKEPIKLSRDSSSLKLLQYVRDEAHRFAINFHRDLRNKLITNSILDDIPNIGGKRKVELLKAFGSVNKLRRVSPEEIVKNTKGISAKLAEQIFAYLKKK